MASAADRPLDPETVDELRRIVAAPPGQNSKLARHAALLRLAAHSQGMTPISRQDARIAASQGGKVAWMSPERIFWLQVAVVTEQDKPWNEVLTTAEMLYTSIRL